MVKRHQKATSATMQGGIIDKAMPIDASNVAILSLVMGNRLELVIGLMNPVKSTDM